MKISLFSRKIHTLLFLCVLVLGIFPHSLSALGVVDFNLKIAISGDETYTTALSNVSTFNTDITFQFVEISDGGPKEYSLNLPTGFLYQWRNTTGSTCTNFSVLNANNGNYHFSFDGGAGCLAKTEFTYRVTSSAVPGNASIFLLRKNGTSWTIENSVTLGIVSTNSLTKALTADLNANGYIDAYVLSTASTGSLSSNSFSGITVAGVSTWGASASGSNWILPFTDNILTTGDIPQIGGVFDGVTLNNTSLSEEDGARPRIMTIAGSTTTISSITIGTGAFSFVASEQLSPTSVGSFSLLLGTGAISGNMTFSGTDLRTLVFTPTSPLLAGTYTLSNGTGASDWSVGANSLSQAFPSLIVPDTTLPTGSILINAGAASTTSQTVSLTLAGSDNIGVTSMIVSNSPTFVGASWEAYATTRAGWVLSSSAAGTYTVYVKFRDAALNESAPYSDSINIVAAPVTSGGGGGGWGGSPSPDYCPTGDLSGNLYDAKCTAPLTASGTLSSTGTTSATGIISEPLAPWIPSVAGSPSNISSGTIDTYYFSTIEEARSYLLEKVSHRAIVKLINTYGSKLSIPDISYFLSVDRTLYHEYNRLVNGYTLLFLRVQDAVSGNTSSTVKTEGRMGVSIVLSGVTFAQTFLDRYVLRTSIGEKGITLYRTRNPLLVKPLGVLENKIITKFDALLESGTITRDEYDSSVQAYNDFVLHLMLYRDYGKNPLSKDRALKAIKIFSATYAKKIIPPSEPTIDQTLEQQRLSYLQNNPISSPQKIGEIYTFPRDLKFGETSQDVRNLQAILKSYGYFGTLNPTGYFGAVTKSYLIQFSKEILGIDNPNGLFDAKIRWAIVTIEIR